MDLHDSEPVRDRRVRRTRAAVMQAAVALVSERGTKAVTIAEIAETADVSRRVVYQHFGDLDGLLLEAGLDLARRELLPGLSGVPEGPDGRAEILALARHFVRHRPYYRALLTGSCAFALDRGLISLMLPVNRQFIERIYGDRLAPQGVDDLASFMTGGAGALVTTWVVQGEEPLDAEAFTDRLLGVLSVLMTAMSSEASR